MRPTSVNEIRKAFLDYFRREGHEIVPSSPLVPRNDPTLMFTNAGMVQFKNVFTGLETRPYTRAATAQKCVRAGGKHNDLDNVGYTARHHTFFEMLGNFSFGDYFKERAIELAWNLVTREFGLPVERLLVTVYAEDDEAFDLWKKIAGLPDEKIIRIAGSDNFWSMGDTGPCGPCSEIFYDHGEHIPGGPPGSPDEDGDRFVEIWNLVFMQYDQISPQERVPLPKPSIDTGMGLERIAAVLQGTHDNYEIDLFRAIIAEIEELSGVRAEGDKKPSHRVIADHLRATAFLIADGVLPSNEGRGYVLRRIMRRAMRHMEMLGVKEPMMHRLFPVLKREMGEAYPELAEAEALITETMKLEETRFRKTLARGLKILEEEAAGLRPGDVFPGEVAFRLYDTYGFPLDLTEDALRARGITVDIEGFNAAMARQRETARRHWAGSGEQAEEAVWFEIREKVGATEFLGYETEKAEGVIKAIVRDGAWVTELKEGEEGILVLNQTPFYAESGGQVGDKGVIRTASGAIFRVHDVQKKADGVHAHYGRVEKGVIHVEDEAELEVDHALRAATRRHHSATHLLHEALRQILGQHVTQKGSLVAPDRLRFDFAHPKAMSEEEIEKVEDLVNTVIAQNDEVVTRLMDIEEARRIGAMALFGEKYGDEVRVVAMGRQPENTGNKDVFSIELCGGTHVRRTGDIGLLKIVSEGAISSGVRRIEALAGDAARAYLEEQEKRLNEVASLLKVSPDQVPARIAALLEERRKLEKELTEARKKLAMGGGGAEEKPEDIGGIPVLLRIVDDFPPKELRGLAEAAKGRLKSGVVAIINRVDGKAGVVVGVTDDLADRINAVDLVRAAAAALGGKGGGGRPVLAQAGGPHPEKAEEALRVIREKIAELASETA
jgi:alanyl-tRNA synthetase